MNRFQLVAVGVLDEGCVVGRPVVRSKSRGAEVPTAEAEPDTGAAVSEADEAEATA